MSPATAYVTLLAVKAKFTTSSNTCPECRSGSGGATHLQWRRLSRSTRKSTACRCFASDDIAAAAYRPGAERPGGRGAAKYHWCPSGSLAVYMRSPQSLSTDSDSILAPAERARRKWASTSSTETYIPLCRAGSLRAEAVPHFGL